MPGPDRTFRPFVAVQHRPPARAKLLPRLLERLDELPVEVVSDEGEPPDPWRGHLRCLERMSESFTHLVVIQDDALVCDAFECELHCAIEAEPDATLILFLASQPRLTAMAANRAVELGEPFARLHERDYLPAVGISYPAAHVADVLDWNSQPRARRSRSDDFMLGQWHRDRKPCALVCVPSLVQHPDDVPSVIGNGLGAHGRNRARTALHWID